MTTVCQKTIVRGKIETPSLFDSPVQKKNTDFTFIDLFAGVGGIRIGFEEVGGECVFSSEWDKSAQKTYQLNFGELPHGDITQIEAEEIPKFDVLLAGFPCQPFSVAGYRQGFGDENGRGNLFFDIVRILEYHKPKAFLLENVKNLKGHDNGNTIKVIYQELEKLGYFVKDKIMSSAEYGNVPQNRERIYIAGFLNKKHCDNFVFPKKEALKRTIQDCLEKNVDQKYYYNNKLLFDRIKDDITKEDTVYQWRRKYVRENKNNLCPTLTANMGMGGHNVPLIKDKKGIRKLTPRECANFQGFPRDYKIPGLADSHLYKQFGNSVSVPVIRRIAINIKKAFQS
jgi:DNA (cytosine-5)-methyltransferase 1